jgi:exonuclease VII small subunit
MILPFLVLVNGVLGSYGIKKVKSGTDKIIEADKKLDKAYKRNTHNINRLNNETEKTNKSLEALGKKEYEIIDSFGEFIDVWETLQNKPEFKDIEKDNLHLPEYDLEEIKKTFLSLGKFADFLNKAGKSALTGLAIGGVFNNILLTVPTIGGVLPVVGNAMFMGVGSGLGTLAAGSAFDKKGDKKLEDAEETLKKVIENEEKVKEFAEFCNTLRDTSYRLYLTLTSLQTKYKSYMVELHRIADLKDEEFSESDMLKMKNAVLVVSLLYKLCALELVKGENGDELNNVEVEKQIEEAEKIKETL